MKISCCAGFAEKVVPITVKSLVTVSGSSELELIEMAHFIN